MDVIQRKRSRNSEEVEEEEVGSRERVRGIDKMKREGGRRGRRGERETDCCVIG